MWSPYRVAAKVLAMIVRASARAFSRLASALSMQSAARGARRGYLAPGDPPPPPTAPTDYLDYRGVAVWQEAKALAGMPFGLGSFMDLRRGRPRGPIGLPPQVLTRHAVVIGPAGSGKTAGLLIPWMHSALSIGWSVVAIDVKGDLREDFVAYGNRYGVIPGAQLRKWDFTDPSNSTSWQWLSELKNEPRVDAAVTAVIGRAPEKSSVDPFFYKRDYRTLRGLLKFARSTARRAITAGVLIALLEDQPRLEAALARNPRAPGVNDLTPVTRSDPLDYERLVTGVVTALSAMDIRDVDAVTRENRLDIERALDDHHCLIVGAPLRGGEVSATLASLLLNQLKQRLYERFGQQRRPVLLVIDEAAQVASRVDIAQLMEVARSAGVGVVVALQDAAKLRDENDRSSILSNAAAMALLPGSSPLSVNAFSSRLGQRFERTRGMSTGGRSEGWFSTPQENFGTEAVPVLREREIMQNPFGSRPAVVQVYAGELGITAKPLLVDLYRED